MEILNDLNDSFILSNETETDSRWQHVTALSMNHKANDSLYEWVMGKSLTR